MSIQDYINEMMLIQSDFLEFIENETEGEEEFKKLTKLFEDLKISENQHKLKSILHLLIKISNNHHRNHVFFTKIEQIILHFKADIKKYFSNSEIFDIFKSNKRILLFLIEEHIMIFDEYIFNRITTKKFIDSKYPFYFSPEIKPFLTNDWIVKYQTTFENFYKYLYDIEIGFDFEWIGKVIEEIPDDFFEKRKIGENDDLICELIRNDFIEKFIIIHNQLRLKIHHFKIYGK